MLTSLTISELTIYLERQINGFFPDNKKYIILEDIISLALEKVQFNFQHMKLDYFFKNNQVYFNHLNADQYTIFIYYASNIAYEYFDNIELATKLFYLNKILHGFHCMYDTKLPDIFLVIHGNGIVLGKAKYSNYFVVMHGVTVGSNSKWESPTLGERLVMYPNSSLLGKSIIANGNCFSNGSLLSDFNTVENSLIIDKSPNLIIKKQTNDKSKIYFRGKNE